MSKLVDRFLHFSDRHPYLTPAGDVFEFGPSRREISAPDMKLGLSLSFAVAVGVLVKTGDPGASFHTLLAGAIATALVSNLGSRLEDKSVLTHGHIFRVQSIEEDVVIEDAAHARQFYEETKTRIKEARENTRLIAKKPETEYRYNTRVLNDYAKACARQLKLGGYMLAGSTILGTALGYAAGMRTIFVVIPIAAATALVRLLARAERMDRLAKGEYSLITQAEAKKPAPSHA